MSDRLAILFSDGSLSILRPLATLDCARRERDFANGAERRPEHRGKIVRVALTIGETLT
jgi:hypothetical protein